MSEPAGLPEPPWLPDLAFVRLAGDERSERLLVLGPSLGTGVADLWRHCVALLPPTWEVVGWDLPGHGSSPGAMEGFTVADLAAVVCDGATGLAKGRPASYAGVSMGGAVGLAIAAEPRPFNAVVTIAAAPVIGTPDGWRERAAHVRRAGTGAMVESSAARWFAPGFLERDGRLGGGLLLALREVDDNSYALACEALATYDAGDLGDVAVPLLVVGGEHDVVVPPAAVHAAAAAAPGARGVVLQGVGHLPPTEAPAAIAELISDFLNPTQELA